MKKYLSIITVILIAFLLVGCSKQKDSEITDLKFNTEYIDESGFEFDDYEKIKADATELDNDLTKDFEVREITTNKSDDELTVMYMMKSNNIISLIYDTDENLMRITYDGLDETTDEYSNTYLKILNWSKLSFSSDEIAKLSVINDGETLNYGNYEVLKAGTHYVIKSTIYKEH